MHRLITYLLLLAALTLTSTRSLWAFARIEADPETLRVVFDYVGPQGEPVGSGLSFALINSGDEEFGVISVECRADWLGIDFRERALQPGERLSVECSIEDEPDPGEYRATIEVRTDNLDLEMLEIPVFATIARSTRLIVDGEIVISILARSFGVACDTLFLRHNAEEDVAFNASVRYPGYDDDDAPDILFPNPARGSIRAGATLPMQIRVEPRDISPSGYYAILTVTPEDDEVLPAIIDFHLTIQPAPTLDVSWPNVYGYPVAVDFNRLERNIGVGETYAIELGAYNGGNATLNISEARCTNRAFRVDGLAATLEPGADDLFRLLFTPPEAADYEGWLLITSDNALREVDSVFFVANGVGVGVEEESSAPAEFSLDDPAPNPFNNRTTITYSLRTQEPAALTITTLTGGIVYRRELPARAGRNSLLWDAGGLPGGIYLIRLESGRNVRFGKAILLK